MPLPKLLGGKDRSRAPEKKKERRLRSFHTINWKDPEDIVSFVMGMWDTRRQRRWWLERQWYINISYFLGHQWVEWNANTGSLFTPKAPRWRVRITANLVQGIARKIMAMILAQRPIWTAQPATGDPQDAIVARITEKVMKHYWMGPFQADPKMVDAMMWMTTTGLGIWRLHWDPTASSEIAFSSEDVEDKSLLNDLKKLEREGKNRMNIGDLAIDAKSPFQIDPDPWCTDFTKLNWLIDTSTRSVEWVEQQYPKTGKGIEPDDDENLNFFERRISDLAGPNQRHFMGTSGQHNQASKQQNMVTLHELYAKPFGKFRHGIYVVVAGDRLLDIRVNPWRARGEIILPYGFFEEIKVPGRIWPTCAMEQSISLQAEYNKGRSQVVENRNLMSRPKWFVPDGAGIGDDALTSEPGEVVTHVFGHKPEAWTPPPLPPYVLRTLELARQDIQDASLIHEVSQAKAPSGVKSGRAILALQEQDQTVIAPAVMCIENELTKLGAAAMDMVSQRVKEKRLIKITGKNETYEVEEFLGTDLVGPNAGKPGAIYFDVRVKMGSQLPLTPEAKRQAIVELTSAGILNVQSDRDRILELLELGSDEPLYDTARMDRSNQRRENRVMLFDKEFVQVQDYDDDLEHIRVMEEFQKSPEYAERRDDETIRRFNDHKRQHLANAQAKADGTFEIVDPGQPAAIDQGVDINSPDALLANLLAGGALAAPEPPSPPPAGAPGEVLI